MTANPGRTHWETCWREHLECAVAKVERAEGELTDVREDMAQLTLGVIAMQPYIKHKYDCALEAWGRECPDEGPPTCTCGFDCPACRQP